jgi:ribosome-associated heat shock protein Hsp15
LSAPSLPPETPPADASLRLDVWLWRARFFRTRTLAGDHVRAQGVRLTHLGQTRRIDRPATLVTIGDGLTFTAGTQIETCDILLLGTRRGPPAEAQTLYCRKEPLR